MDSNNLRHLQDKARGMLLGLAIGDALGAPYEIGWQSEQIKKLGRKLAHFARSPLLPPGFWTDDTSMALCLADSLIANNGYNSYDLMTKFSNWFYHGYRSSYGNKAFDVGAQTARTITAFATKPTIPAKEAKAKQAGNGAIMRLAPVAIANTFIAHQNSKTISPNEFVPITKMAILSCRETHNAIAAECVTQAFAVTLYSAMRGHSKTQILSYLKKHILHQTGLYADFWQKHAPILAQQIYGNSKDLHDLDGRIFNAFSIALWGFLHSRSFLSGAVKVIRLGGDTDTNAAIFGQLAGAYYGYKKLPKNLRAKVYLASEIIEIADTLLKMPACPILKTRFEDDAHFVRN